MVINIYRVFKAKELIPDRIGSLTFTIKGLGVYKLKLRFALWLIKIGCKIGHLNMEVGISEKTK